MFISTIRNLFVLVTGLLSICATTYAQQPYSQETLDKIREVETNITGSLLVNDEKPSTIQERMAKYKVKGLSIAVIHNYKIVWAKGYGWADEGEKRPVTPETLFEPGSISKSLNAVGVLKLAQDGKIELNQDINTYLKSWKFPYDSVSKGKKITVANLLSHTAGLTVHGFPGHPLDGPIPTLLQVLDGIKPSFTPAVRSQFEPGLRFQYSGGGTSISQIILTDIVQQPYDVWMYEHVLKPIGMTHSTYTQPLAANFRHLAATAYNRDGYPLKEKFHMYPEQAAAGLWMTPTDLCNYIIDMQLAYQGKPSKVLSAEMVKLHLTPYIDKNAAMGTFVVNMDSALYFQHSAGNDGFSGVFYGSLENGNGVAVFQNTDNFQILPEVVNSVAKAYNWKKFYKAPMRKSAIQVSDEVIKNYEGIYLYDDAFAVVGKKDNAYHFYTDGTFAKMYFTSPETFFNEEFRAVKTFVKDDQGKVIGYKRQVDAQSFPLATRVGNIDTLKASSEIFNGMGWYYFEVKNYKESLHVFTRGTTVHPNDLNLWMNKAHLHLFNNEYAKARDIYKAHLNETIRKDFSWQDSMREDYRYFADRGYNMAAFDKVFAELNIQK
jgi:CubicO group peptidase (beta-lactamase class C family)